MGIVISALMVRARGRSSCWRRGTTWRSRTTRRSPTRGSRGGGSRGPAGAGGGASCRCCCCCRSSPTSAWRSPRWARDGRSRRCRVAYTLQYYERVIVETPKYILNSFLYSGLAVVICVAGRRADRVAAGALHRAGARRARRAQHPDPGHAGHRDRHRLHPRLPLRPAGLRPRRSPLLDHHAAGARRPPAALHGARLAIASLLLVHRSMEEAAGERGRRRGAHVPRRHAAAHLEGRPGGRPLLVHDLAAGGLRGALPGPGRLGDRSPTASSPSTSRAAPTRRPPSA